MNLSNNAGTELSLEMYTRKEGGCALALIKKRDNLSVRRQFIKRGALNHGLLWYICLSVFPSITVSGWRTSFVLSHLFLCCFLSLSFKDFEGKQFEDSTWPLPMKTHWLVSAWLMHSNLPTQAWNQDSDTSLQLITVSIQNQFMVSINQRKSCRWCI